MTDALSDFDVMLKMRLPNWGRWGRQDSDRPDPEGGCGSIYQMGRGDRTGEDEAPPEPPPPRINHMDAERLDRLIQRLPMTPRHVICGHFYKRRESYMPKVHAAVRALLDAEDAAEKKVIRWVA